MTTSPTEINSDRRSIVKCRSFEMVGGPNHWQEFQDLTLDDSVLQEQNKTVDLSKETI